MGWIGCVRCEKFQNNFMAQTCAFIAPVQPVLHQVSCSNETLPNAPKNYETHQNMSLGSNGVVRVRSLRKFRCDFVAKTFALIALVQLILHQASCSYETIQNEPQPLRNAAIREFRVQWSGSGAFVAKNSKTTSWYKLVH